MNISEGLVPKWDKWLKMIDATDFQLIALSLNYEPPSTLKTITRFQGLSCYAERLSIIKNHITNKQLAYEQRRCGNTDKIESYVQLDAFVKWAVDVMAWDLPPELLIIKNASTPAAPSQNLTQENKLLKQQLNDAQAKIEILEKQLSDLEHSQFKGACCDESNIHYPPELHMVIRMWEDLYIHGQANLERDSHSADVEKWLKSNHSDWVQNNAPHLLKGEAKDCRPLERLKTVTAPQKKKGVTLKVSP